MNPKSNSYQPLASALDYQFSDVKLLELALSHRSTGKYNNERLEFLGDALLGVIISEVLYERFPNATEGELTRLRSSLVRGDTLAQIGIERNIGQYLLLGSGELKSGGKQRSSILADTVEALIGAIYLEAGLSCCRRCVIGWFASRIDAIKHVGEGKDAKTRLQEYLQERGYALPIYELVETKGSQHAREFVIACRVVGVGTDTGVKAVAKKDLGYCLGQSTSKRAAEKLSAEKMLAHLEGLE